MSSSPAPVPAADDRWDARLWGALIVLCGVLFLDGLDVSMVGVALPRSARPRPLHLGPPVGRLRLCARLRRPAPARRPRRRPPRPPPRAARRPRRVHASPRCSAGSWTTARCSSPPASSRARRRVHRAGRPVDHHDDVRRGPGAQPRALASTRPVGASGFSLGLVLGGLLTELGWRWTFLLPVPIALALLVAGAARHRRATSRRPAASAAASTSPARSRSPRRCCCWSAPSSTPRDAGWARPRRRRPSPRRRRCSAAFVAIEQRAAHPLVRLGILRSGPLVRANLGHVAVFGAYVSFQFLGTLYLQSVLGWSALRRRSPSCPPADRRLRRTADRAARRPLRHGRGDRWPVRRLRDRLRAVPEGRRVVLLRGPSCRRCC